jgi:hypothetical protein
MHQNCYWILGNLLILLLLLHSEIDSWKLTLVNMLVTPNLKLTLHSRRPLSDQQRHRLGL